MNFDVIKVIEVGTYHHQMYSQVWEAWALPEEHDLLHVHGSERM